MYMVYIFFSYWFIEMVLPVFINDFSFENGRVYLVHYKGETKK